MFTSPDGEAVRSPDWAWPIHVDLGQAFAKAGERELARHNIRIARELALEVGSQRLLHLVNSIELP